MSNRKITDMVALTTPASDDVLPIVDISEAAAVDKNKKISIEELFKGVPNGTAAAPSIAFESDDDNGIFLAGTNTVGITTAGTQRVAVDSSGNVGIATSNPGAPLDVNGLTILRGAATADVLEETIRLARKDNSAIRFHSIKAKHSGSASGNALALFMHNASTDTSQAEVMRILGNGNIGIGSNNPGALLEVLSSGSGTETIAQFGNSAISGGLQIQTNGNLDWGFNARNSRNLTFSTNQLERLRISSTGSVGIGTSSPQAKLDVSGTILTETVAYANNRDQPYLIAGTTNHTGATTNWGTYGFQHRFKSDASGTGRVTIDTNNGEAFCVDNANRVGIGTSSPSQRLNLNIGGDQTWLQIDKSRDANEPMLQLVHSEGNRSAKIRYANSQGSWSTGISGNESFVISSGENATGTGGSEHLRIDGSGRLLAGTSSSFADSSRLQVLTKYNTFESGISLRHTQFTASSSFNLNFERSRDNFGGDTAVINGSRLGQINFKGYDGTDYESIGASIYAEVDGTPGANDMPGRLVFSTCADGASSPTERLRIDSSGRVMIGTTTNNGAALTVDSGGGSNVVIRDNSIENHKSNSNGSIAVNYKGYANGTTQFRDFQIFNGKNGHIATFDGSTNNVGIGTTSPGVKLAVAGTDAIQVPAGTTAQRPTAAAGQIRLNTTHGYYEGYDGTNWTNLRTLVQSYLPSGTQACDSTTLTTIDVIENNESYSDSLTTESAGVYTFARAGVYEIYIRLTVNGTASNYRWTSRLRATKNGTSTVVGEVEGGYLRGDISGQSTMCFVTMAFTHQFAASDTLTFQIQRISNVSGSATIQVEGTNVIIKALKTID